MTPSELVSIGVNVADECRVTINRFRGTKRGATFKRFLGPVAELHIDGTGVEARYQFRLTDGLGDDEKMAPWRIELDDLERLRKLAHAEGISFKEKVGDPRYLTKRQRPKKAQPADPRQRKMFG